MTIMHALTEEEKTLLIGHVFEALELFIQF